MRFLSVFSRNTPNVLAKFSTAYSVGPPSNALVRFLGDQAGTIDVIRVMTALPMGDFIRQALRHVVSA